MINCIFNETLLFIAQKGFVFNLKHLILIVLGTGLSAGNMLVMGELGLVVAELLLDLCHLLG